MMISKKISIAIVSFLCGTIAAIKPLAAGVVGNDERLPIAQFAKQKGISETEARAKFAATGRIMCPFNEATAFLVEHKNIIVTARHAIFPEKSMVGYAGRSSLGNCAFEVSFGKTSVWYDIDVKSIEYPKERQRSFNDRFDWIAMRLKKPVVGVKPYMLPTEKILNNTPITVVSIRQEGFPYEDWNERIVTACKVQKIWNIDRVAASGLETDCDLTSKSSGSPLLHETPHGLEVIGVQSSGVANCKKFRSKRCSNWAVGVTDEIIKAVARLTTVPVQQ